MVDAKIEQRSFQAAMKHAPENLYREIRSAWKAHHRKFSGVMKRERMSGRPGLKAPTGTLRRGLVVKDEGNSLNTLEVSTMFTGAHAFFAHVHETGMVISAKGGGYLTFPIRSGGAARSTKITGWARVKSVTIPARLGFKKTFDRMTPALVKATNTAVHKALVGEAVR